MLSAIREQVLSPDILEAAIDRAAERLSTSQHDDEAERLRDERDTVEGELSHLVSALASGANLPTVVQAIHAREARREAIVARLASLERVAAMPRKDRGTLRAELQRRAEDWREPLARNVPQARQLLRKVLADRLTVTPDTAADRESAITGDASLTKILAEIVFPKGMASPTGVVPEWTREVPGEVKVA